MIWRRLTHDRCPVTDRACDQQCPDPDCARMRYPEDFGLDRFDVHPASLPLKRRSRLST